jgi:hypothetical protein
MHFWVIAWLREVDAIAGVVLGSLSKVTGCIAGPYRFMRTGPIGEYYNEKQNTIRVSELRY